MVSNMDEPILNVKHHGPFKVSIPLKPTEKGWMYLVSSVVRENIKISIVLAPKRSIELKKTLLEAEIPVEKWREFTEAIANCIIRAVEKQQSNPILWALSKLGAVKADIEFIAMRLREVDNSGFR
jgi:hypothetical protein